MKSNRYQQFFGACVVGLGLSAYASGAFAADVSTKWFFGEGVCAGGWTYDKYKSCPNYSKPISIMGRDEVCGESGQFVQIPNACRHSDFGPPQEASTGIASLTFSLSIQTRGAGILERCKGTIEGDYIVPTGRMDNTFGVLDAIEVVEDSGEYYECLERDSFSGDCTQKVKRRSGICRVTVKFMQYPLKENKDLCGLRNGVPIYNECVVQTNYPVEPQKSCGVESSLRSPPFASLAQVVGIGLGNQSCLTGDDRPDTSTDDLKNKLDFLLSSYDNHDDYDKEHVNILRTSIARYLLKTRSADISEEQIERIWKLNGNFRLLPRNANPVYKESDVKVKVGEKITSLQGTKHLVYASAPRYAEGMAVCWQNKIECGKRDADWVFMQLRSYIGSRFTYAGAFKNEVPNTFTVKAYIAGEQILREIKRGVNEDTQLEASELEGGKWFSAFTSRSENKLVIVDLGNNTTVSTFNFFAEIEPDGKFAYAINNGKLKKISLKDGSVVNSWDVGDSVHSVVLSREAAFVSDGLNLRDPEQNVEFALEGLSQPLFRNSLVAGPGVVAADMGDHKINVWSSKTGQLLFSLAHTPSQSYPVNDTIKFFGEYMAVQSYNDELVRVYKDGSLVRTFKVSGSDFFLNSAVDRLVAGGSSIRMYEPDNEFAYNIFGTEANTTREVVSVSADMKKVFVYTRKLLPGNNNTPGQHPLPAYQAMEVWDLEQGLRLNSVNIPGDMNIAGFVNPL